MKSGVTTSYGGYDLGHWSFRRCAVVSRWVILSESQDRSYAVVAVAVIHSSAGPATSSLATVAVTTPSRWSLLYYVIVALRESRYILSLPDVRNAAGQWHFHNNGRFSSGLSQDGTAKKRHADRFCRRRGGDGGDGGGSLSVVVAMPFDGVALAVALPTLSGGSIGSVVCPSSSVPSNRWSAESGIRCSGDDHRILRWFHLRTPRNIVYNIRLMFNCYSSMVIRWNDIFILLQYVM